MLSLICSMNRIMIKRINSEPSKNLDDEIYWFSDQLCLSSGRDINNIATKVLKLVLENSSKSVPLTSLDVSNKLGISLPTVNHHIRNLIDSGILVREKNRIYLRRKTLVSIINELRKDIDRVLSDIEEIANDIDDKLGLNRVE
ncbi:MAG: hypothetical protein PWQ87_261 [Candidatus Woesearchaeota archaeon]|nr:hypothetical protein [Candidatus Woesearchaeota archaeon]